ncbi:hypothetical protein TSUD_114220 [Trifolium subterraneum]|uniref:Uncharacterized protein n=1 Tax=Trifolium subterraneum TaxID=3900 RepID=A0A2Z6MS33_TRISU|nr:hypothetical protein TSUD_114220 [Trifolium subterraneum]
MCDHDWLNLAMADDSIVADLLLRLNNPQPPPPLQLHWTTRQPRSKSIPLKQDYSTRASPNTPLSWSAATSPSDESTLPTKLSQSSRSKTLAELKEEESLLSKERRNLKNELASLRLTIEKERATNESLKRMKLDFESRQNSNNATTSNSSQFVEAVCCPSNSISPKIVQHKVLIDDSHVNAANAPPKVQEIGKQEPKFVLPDLNLLVEEDLSY